MESRMERRDANTEASDARFKMLEKQIRMMDKQIQQIATSFSNLHQQGQFPSNTVVNPKGPCESISPQNGISYEKQQLSSEEPQVVKEE